MTPASPPLARQKHPFAIPPNPASNTTRVRSMSDEFIIRPFASADTEAVIDVWRRCGLLHPHNDPRKDIARKSKVRPDLFLVGTIGGAVVATVMAGYEGHRGWINYLGVAPEYQRRGWGRRMMDEAERLLRREGCPKINLQVRSTNTAVVAFYEAIGFKTDPVVSLGKRLEPDH